jgi:hypothetical protein
MKMEYVTFAARFSVAPADAYVLPALFESVAAKVDLPVRALLARATYSDPGLGEYLAGVAQRVAADDRR